MNFQLYLLLTIFGLVTGSFLGMLVYRLPRGLSVLGRSRCPHCKKKISWYHNIPVFSFFVLSGKCANCGKKISWRYPLTEVSTVLVFLLVGLVSPNNIFALVWFLAVSFVFLALIFIDLEFQILPDGLILFLGVLVLVAGVFGPSPTLFGMFLSGLVSFSFFLALYLITRGRGLGFGDVKLSFVLGAMLGYPSFLVWIFLSFLIGAAGGVCLLVLGKARFGQPIAFGPYLIVASFIAFVWGDIIFKWYISM